MCAVGAAVAGCAWRIRGPVGGGEAWPTAHSWCSGSAPTGYHGAAATNAAITGTEERAMKKRSLTIIAAAAAVLASGATAFAMQPGVLTVASASTESNHLPLTPIVLAGLGCFLILSGRKT